MYVYTYVYIDIYIYVYTYMSINICIYMLRTHSPSCTSLDICNTMRQKDDICHRNHDEYIYIHAFPCVK